MNAEKNELSVVFIIGGPGSGKGTQCSLLAKNYDYIHLSAGELLRKEGETQSEDSEIIRKIIENGQIVPHQITIKLLKNEIFKHSGKNFIIDGFPRKIDQALLFEEEVGKCKAVIFYDCTEEIMCERILHRAKSSNRTDDNINSIKLRFETYKEHTIPVIEYYRKLGLLHPISAVGTKEEVYVRTINEFKNIFNNELPSA